MAKHYNSLDVARLAGVSQTTVSFVLNQRPGHSISAETRQRVLEAAQQLQYRSNRLSNGIFRGNSGLIGLVMPPVTDDYYAEILSSIAALCGDNGKTIVFSPLTGARQTERDPLLRLIEYRVDGIILVCQESIIPELNDWLTELIDKGIKCVVVDDRKHESEVHCVVSEDVAGARQVVSYFGSLGHRNIAHLSAGEDSTTSIDRRLGFLQGMNDLGVPGEGLIIEGTSYLADDGRLAAEKILAREESPTAVFAANDTLAAEFIKAMRNQGLRCPQDISVVGYGNTHVSRALDLTSVDQHPSMIGRLAIETLLEGRDESFQEKHTAVVACDLVVRQTSGKRAAT